MASQCGSKPTAALENLPAGFQHIDDIIVRLQPLRIGSEDDQEALLSTLQLLKLEALDDSRLLKE
jgi:hypothetical protein